MRDTMVPAPAPHIPRAYVWLAVIWIAVGLGRGLNNTFAEPSTGTTAGVTVTVVAPIAVTLLVFSRDRDGAMQQFLFRAGQILGATTLVAMAVRVFT